MSDATYPHQNPLSMFTTLTFEAHASSCPAGGQALERGAKAHARGHGDHRHSYQPPTTLAKRLPSPRTQSPPERSRTLRDSPAGGGSLRLQRRTGAERRCPSTPPDDRLFATGISLVPAETTVMVPLPYFFGSRCSTMARATARYSAPRTFFFTAANCFSAARVARRLPPCFASLAKIVASCAGVLPSPKITSACPRAGPGDDRLSRIPGPRKANAASAGPRRRARVSHGVLHRTVCGWSRSS